MADFQISEAETIPHDFGSEDSTEDPLSYMFAGMSAEERKDYTWYVKFQIWQEHPDIHWWLRSSTKGVMDFISSTLDDTNSETVYFGITTSPYWRMTKRSWDPSRHNPKCSMVPHDGDWANMYVLYTNFGQHVGDLEVESIATFGARGKVRNSKPGKECYAHDHPSFFYMLVNSHADNVRLARMRGMPAGTSPA